MIPVLVNGGVCFYLSPEQVQATSSGDGDSNFSGVLASEISQFQADGSF
jgi:hypothetical protein